MHTYLKLNEEKLDLLIKVLHDSQYETEHEKVIANELYEKFRHLCLDNFYNLGEGWDDEEECQEDDYWKPRFVKGKKTDVIDDDLGW